MRRVASLLDGMSPPSTVRVRDLLALKSCVTHKFDHGLALSLCEQHQIGLSTRWHMLSKGQKRWVVLAAGLASRAELFLLDEPADGLDVSTRRELYGLLRGQANEQGISVVVASHIIADLERVADDVAILIKGQLRLHSPLETLRDETCEIEIRSDSFVSEITTLAEIVSSHRTDQGLLAVIRFRSPHLVEQRLPGEVNRRRLGLEELYLAYTQPTCATERLDTSLA